MGSLYYDLKSILAGAGLTVNVSSVNQGWERRARSSGGFNQPPLGCWWHHTASQASPENDLNYMINVNDDAPVGNMLLDRNGEYWPIAGGASNCAGKGGPWTFSRGVCPLDSGNTYGFQIEVANNGVGEPWPQVQIDSYFIGSNALNKAVGNQPTDVVGHHHYTPGRKIDPATAAAVQGPWQPRSINSSGTWNLDDIKNQCLIRSGQTPPPDPGPDPEPPPGGFDWMAELPTIKKGDRGDYVERMQHLLAAAGFMNPANTANYDGVWGNGTENAKINFDNAHGLTPSPPTDCGPKSWESLMTGRRW